MKQKWLAMVLVLALCVGAFSVTALADGEEDTAWVEGYGDIGKLNSNFRYIIICPWWYGDTIDEKEYFNNTWPYEETTITLKSSYGSYYHMSDGTLTIPSNVTIEAYDYVELGSTTNLIINGTWKAMDNQGYLAGSGSVTVGSGGKIVTECSGVQPVWVNKFTLNGTMVCNKETILMNTRLGAGAKTTGEILQLRGNVTGPSSGKATIENNARMFLNDVTISGNLDVSSLSVSSKRTLTIQSGLMNFDKIQVTDGSTLHISSGSTVEVDDLYINDGKLEIESGAYLKVNELKLYYSEDAKLNGTLEITGNGGISDTHIQMDNGTLILRAGTEFGKREDTSKLEGTGTVKFYGSMDASGNLVDVAILHGLRPDFYERDAYVRVADTISFWTNWENCPHRDVLVTDDAVPVAPTCGVEGYTPGTCTECGMMQMTNLVSPTWEHEWKTTTTTSVIEFDGGKRITTSTVKECAGCNQRTEYTDMVFQYDVGEKEGWLMFTATNLKEGDCVAAALYDEHGKFLGITTGTANKQSITLEMIRPETMPDKVKLFVTTDDWAAKRPVEDLTDGT